MNDQEFNEHAFANPFDDSSEFLAAMEESPERKQLIDELQQFDSELSTTLASVSAPDKLKASLLDPEALEQARQPLSSASPDKPQIHSKAANDSHFFKRMLPAAAACLLIAVSFGIFYSPNSINAADRALEVEVLAHIYQDISDLQMDDNLLVADINSTIMATVGSSFQQNEALADVKVDMIKDCWIAKENSIHMIMQGNTGAVTVMIIPGSPVENEFAITDDRFAGVISPTPVGNLVVIGEKQEPILDMKNLLASNINW